MQIEIKRFDQLSREELYAILKLRVDVFVVEQQCPFPDLDDHDQQALHVFMTDEDGIEAYLRILDRGVVSEYVSIGRVISVKRRRGLAGQLLDFAIAQARERFGADKIYLEAQTYASGLYEKHGFRQISEEFLEDGIPHIQMLLEIQ